MKEQVPPPTVSHRTWFIVTFVILGTAFQAAHVKTGYNIPYKSIETTFSETLCFPGSCADEKSTKLGLTFFWTLTGIAEPLGAIPAFLIGRNVAEKFGRKSVIFLSFLPLSTGLTIQGCSAGFRNSIFIPLGRLFHAFGATLLLIGGITFVSDLLKPTVQLQQVIYTFWISLAGFLPLIQILTLPQVLGGENLLLWLNAGSAVMLILLILLFLMVPEPPRYLHSIGAKEDLEESLNFYSSPRIIPLDVFMSQVKGEKSSNDWDRKQSFSALKVVKRQTSHQQLDTVYIVILCSVVQSLLMSNVIYLFLAALLQQGMGFSAKVANLETISAFVFGFVASLVSLKLGKLTKARPFTLCCCTWLFLCYLLFSTQAFLQQYLPSPPAALHQVMYLGLLLLFPNFSLGLASLAEDVALEWLIPAAQGPTIAIGMAMGKFADFLVSGTFYPIFQYGGLGYAWLCVLLPLLVCLPMLVAKLPKEKRTRGTAIRAQVPLVVHSELEADIESPCQSPTGQPIEFLHRSQSFSGFEEKEHGKTMQFLGKKKDSKTVSPAPVRKVAALGGLDPELAKKLRKHSKSEYLHKHFFDTGY